jgi:DNA-binding MarR family transcriptional regulator
LRAKTEVSIPVEESADEERLIHEKTRLSIVCTLAMNESMTFTDLKKALNITDGNLAMHTRKLETAQYIVAEKSFHNRVPRTTYWLTEKGREALQRFLDHMQTIIEATRPPSR